MYFDTLSSFLDAGKSRQDSRLAPRMSRRQFGSLAVVATVVAAFEPTASFAAETFDLRPDLDRLPLRQIKVSIAVRGELKLNADGKKVKHVPLRVDANLRYDERLPTADERLSHLAALRHYWDAKAEIQVGDTPFTTELRPERRLIAVQAADDQVTLFSPTGPLTREELELIDVQGNCIVLAALLPEKPIEREASWPVPDRAIARLLCVEAISQNDVQGTLKSVDGHVAVCHFAGTVQAAVGGVATEIELKAKCNFDLSQKLITWLAMAVKEQRSIGHAEPGFDVVSNVRVAIEPVAASEPLAEKSIAGLPLDVNSGSTLLSFDASKAHFRLLFDRRWRVMTDRHDVTILRLVDRGDLIAQCNIASLPDLPAGRQLALEELRDDIKQSLEKNAPQFVEATQSVSDDGLRTLRTVVVGQVAELPIQWVYYHLSNHDGRRASFVFTLENGLVERFAEVDRALTDSFQFLPRPTPTESPAKKPEPSPTAAKTKSSAESRK